MEDEIFSSTSSSAVSPASSSVSSFMSSSAFETMSNPHHQALVDSMSKLMDNEKYSDLVIKCEGREWKVHKAVFCSVSDVFEKACTWVTLDGKETELIEHGLYDGATMHRLISYVYKRTYDVDEYDGGEQDKQVVGGPAEVCGNGERDMSDEDNEKVAPQETAEEQAEEMEEEWSATAQPGGDVDGNPENEDQTNRFKLIAIDSANPKLIAHANVYGIADYYDIPTLKTYAAEQFRDIAASAQSLHGLIDVISAVGSCSGASESELLSVLRDHIMNHCFDLVTDDDFMHSLADLRDAHELAVGLFRELVLQLFRLKGKLAQTMAEWESKAQRLEADWNHTQTIAESNKMQLDNLLGAIKGLPEQCRNSNCTRKFDELTFETSGTDRLVWRIRCARCRCKLVNRQSESD